MTSAFSIKPQSNFERLVEGSLKVLDSAVWHTPLGDSHKLAFLQGRHDGLTEALKLYRKAAHADPDQDEAV